MERKLPRALLVWALLLLIPVDLTWAEAVRYRLAPARGLLGFKASSRLADADGRFQRFAGEIRVVEAIPKTERGKIARDRLLAMWQGARTPSPANQG